MYRQVPGEPPRIDTKNLHESIMTETEAERTAVETRIGTNVVYGRYLELGTSKDKTASMAASCIQ